MKIKKRRRKRDDKTLKGLDVVPTVFLPSCVFLLRNRSVFLFGHWNSYNFPEKMSQRDNRCKAECAGKKEREVDMI